MIVGGAELGPYGSSRTRLEMRSTTSCRRPACSSLRGPPAWSSRRMIPPRAGTTRRPATWSTRASWWSATTTRSSSVSASASRRRRCDRSRSRFTAAGFGVPRQGHHVCRVVGGRGAAVRGLRPDTPSSAPAPDNNDWQVTRKAGTEIERLVSRCPVPSARGPDGLQPDGVSGPRRTAGRHRRRLALADPVTTVDASLVE